MEDKCFDTLEECRLSTEEGGAVLLEKPTYSRETGKIITYCSLVKKNDKYTIFKYGEWEYVKSLNKYKWCSRYETYSATKDYIPAETFIISLVKIVFKNEHNKIARDNYKE